MENKAHALAAGVFVAAVAALLLGLAAWLARDTAQYQAYEISTRVSITGLQEQAPVRYRGVDCDGRPVEREVTGFHARVVQHEYDHLDGVLYTMRLTDFGLFGFNEELNRAAAAHAPAETPE